ncbi:MAG: diaminohydroxyphosphoribosylaminopyrimidine deaminase [Pseudohongiellaceae bacterium]|jgi:diaminohydroxyphosphoribosylaminopyrimidine deaminase/5-amino-6-(5-phosphoribosylamino)uracil reductase
MQIIPNAKLDLKFLDWPVYMAQATSLAQNVINTSPNPRVGCVIVCRSGQLALGWHEMPGHAHAEIMALSSAKTSGLNVKGATVFVSLEPCAHHGRTGPCAEALVNAGVEKVVIATLDPNPIVSGKGVAIMESAGIEVIHLFDFEEQARSINSGFFKRMETGLPFVRVKLAMSLDGRTALANGESQWITSADSRRDVQRLRASVSAVVTGVESVLKDDPLMNVRADALGLTGVEKAANKLSLDKQPLRVILDSTLRTPSSAKIYGPGAVKLFTLASKQEMAAYSESIPAGCNVKVVSTPAALIQGKKRVNLLSVLESLAQIECNDVLVEAGPTLCGAFIDAKLVDELVVYIAPKLLGANSRPLLELKELTLLAQAPEFRVAELSQIGADIKVVLRPQSVVSE